ncbi:MAG: hypothetical protein E7474_09505 [Ruminococcaceae bacterium]|nr:hypothetical protein [Oscillospiraceae bacterium]
MPRAIRICKSCGGKYVEYRSFRGPGGTQRGKDWEKAAAVTPGLCNDCKLTARHHIAEETAQVERDSATEMQRRIADGIASLSLPTLTGNTDRQIKRAENLRYRFLAEERNLRLAKLLQLAPQVYGSSSSEKQRAMMSATRKTDWGNNFAGAFAYANAGFDKSGYEEILGERFSGSPGEYIQFLQALLSETDAKAIIAMFLR